MTRESDIEKRADSGGANESADRIQILRPLLPDAGCLLSYLRRIDAARIYTNWGPLTSEFEDRLSAYLSVPAGCVTTASSGTDALVGSILASAGRASADRPLAIVPAFTFVATALAAELCGYVPHLADIDADSWQLEAAMLSGHPLLRKVGVVIPVAPFGRAVDQAPWVDFHRNTGVPVVIDGGASFEGIVADPPRFLGAVAVALSFHATKSFATAEGGCVITTKPSLAERLGQALNFGFLETRDCRAASTNGKLSEYHAAVGLAELDGWTSKQLKLRALADLYRRQFAAAGLGERLLVCPNVAGCYALFRCSTRAEAASIIDSLEAANIESRYWYGHGLHTQSYYADVSRDRLPVTEHIAPLTIGLPVAPDLSEASVARVIAAIARGQHSGM